MEVMVAQMIKAARAPRAVKRSDLKRVIVGTTVQEKRRAYPMDSRLLEVVHRAVRYAHARQFKRMRRVIHKQRTVVGRLIRGLDRVARRVDRQQLTPKLSKAGRLRTPQKTDQDKLNAWYAPEVKCIGKAKARQSCEFGVKVGMAGSATTSLVLGSRSFPGNPYDGDTLAELREQTWILSRVAARQVIVDLGYGGRDVDGARAMHRGKSKIVSPSEKRWLKRRLAVEPVMVHVKDEHRLRRNFLKIGRGNALNAAMAAHGYNLRWLLLVWLTIWATLLALRPENWSNVPWRAARPVPLPD